MTYHVVPYTKGFPRYRWAVKRSGNTRISEKATIKKAAIKKAKRFARRNTVDSVVVHRANGTTQYSIDMT